jgi:polygalacturonase
MHTLTRKSLLLVMLLQGIASAAFAASAISTRLDDPKAVYLIAPEFGAHADGKSDDSAALQAAIDKAENNVFAGAGGRTLFILAQHALFEAKLRM